MSLGTTIKTIQDIMRQDTGVDGDAQRISQLVWMIFLKVFDDREKELEVTVRGYRSPIPEKLRWRNWAEDPAGLTGEGLLDFVNELFKELKALTVTGKNGKQAAVVRTVFEDAFNYMKSGTLMRKVINKLNEIDFNRSADRHDFGNIYEQILADLQSAGNAGEYYTPRAVTQFIVDRVDPKLGEKVLDPACGTGGFLTSTIDHVRGRYVKTTAHEEQLQESILGVEKKPLPHLLCVTNMILHGVDVPSQIRRANTLARPLVDYGPKDKVQVVVTNPPFGGIEEPGIENNFPQVFRTRETADLFLLLILRVLEDGGRAALVLPDGTLSGDGVKMRLKERLLEECDLHTIVRLPKGVFSPYTNIKTNLLFFTKGRPTKNVWFYEHPYPDGYKSYSKTKAMRFEEFKPEQEWWEKRKENERAWKVSVEEIKARGYNLDIKNPRAADNGPGDADELLKQYRELTLAVNQARDKLRDDLKASLEKSEGPAKRAQAWRRVTDNFQVFLNNHEGTGRIRKSILELAVQGKLVRQDPDDGSSQDLLAQIFEERQEPTADAKREKSKSVLSRLELPLLAASWSWVEFGSLLVFGPKNGYSPKGVDYETKVKSLTLSATTSGRFDGRHFKYIDEEIGLDSPLWLRDGDVLIQRGNTIDYVGVAAVYRGAPHEFIYPDLMMKVCLSPYLDLDFFHMALNSSVSRKFIQRNATGTAGSMPKINQSVVTSILVPVPPFAEQRRISARVKRLMALCDALETKLQDAEKGGQLLAEAMAAEMVA